MGHNRSRSRQPGRKKLKHPSLLKRINRNAAGIDCGSETHYVAVPSERDPEPVRAFKTFTSDLHRLADWLKACKIKTVAMESTGVYWIPIFEILEERGFEVVLVNARHIKNVPGRKTDVLDCQWKPSQRGDLLRGPETPAQQSDAVEFLTWQTKNTPSTSAPKTPERRYRSSQRTYWSSHNW